MKEISKKKRQNVSLDLNIPGVKATLLRKSYHIKNRGEGHYLLIVTSGCYFIHKKKQIIPVKKGMIAALKEHSQQPLRVIEKYASNSSGILCCIDPEFITRFHKFYQNVIEDAINEYNQQYITEIIVMKITSAMQVSVESLALHFFEYLKNEPILLEMKINTLLMSILSEHKEFGKYLANASNINSKCIKIKIERLLSTYLNTDTSIENVAKSGGFSISVFKKLSRKHLGISPRQWINKERLKQAAILLRDKNNSVSYVSQKIGFRSQSYFIQIFKREYGITPKSFQKNPNETHKNPNEIV